MLDENYSYDPKKRIWKKKNGTDFIYRDGSETVLMDILKNVRDKSVFSHELNQFQKDWATTYHLSGARSNLVRPFEKHLLSDKTVLELGCGCGAITRYLGEVAKIVFAVEGSEERGCVSAERCADLDNVNVIIEKIQDLPETIGKFDVVTLIGVLEYSGNYGLSPVQMLEHARKFLVENGVLILAIENRLGLKYFSGVPEDHLAIPWAGITGGYKKNGVSTWSRKELIAFLVEAGFKSCKQFVPIPDYKLPYTIITSSGLDASQDKLVLEPILASSQRRYENPALFNLKAAWKSVIDAGLLADLADSLCFVAYASENAFPAHEKGLLVQHYGNGAHADKHFAKVLSIVEDNGNLFVTRKKLFPDFHFNHGDYKQVIEDEPYYYGSRVEDNARHCVMCKNWTLSDFAETFSPWIYFILEHKSHDDFLPGKFLDLAPFNLIVSPAGKTHPFDLEWQKTKPVPYQYILVRGLINTFHRIQPVSMPKVGTSLQYKELIKGIFSYFSLEYDENHIEKIWDSENFAHILELPCLSWEAATKYAMRVEINDVSSLLALVDCCASLDVQPAHLYDYIISLQKNIVSMQTQLKNMAKFVDNLKKRR